MIRKNVQQAPLVCVEESNAAVVAGSGESTVGSVIVEGADGGSSSKTGVMGGAHQ